MCARLFVGYDERRDCSIVRAGQGVHVDRRGSKHGHAYELLGHLLSGEIFVEPYLVTLGDRVAISAGTEFITHDAVGWLFPDHPNMGLFGPIKVGRAAKVTVGTQRRAGDGSAARRSVGTPAGPG